MDGLLIVDKPSGWTSHDVVGKVRSLLRQKQVGHTGTLDPLATGVLVLCVGKATRIARYLESADKEYEAVMRLGVVTDTLDADGRVVETRQYAPPSAGELADAFGKFQGELLQQPPAFSAVKVSGVPAYKLARKGQAPQLKERRITIYELTVSEYADPFVRFRVRCSKGAYIRSLCRDLGEALGMGAHLTALRRTRAGGFTIERAWGLDRLASLFAEGKAEEALIPLEKALAEFPAVTLDARDAARIAHGNTVPLASGPGEDQRLADPALPVTVHDGAGRLVAVARVRERLLRPETVLA